MSRINRTRVTSLAVVGVATLAAIGIYAAPQPQGPRAPTTMKTIRQPIGVPRIPLDKTRIPNTVVPRLPGVCAAPVDVNIITPKVGLNMRTEDKAIWYSLVDTIPPVGHTASITINPVRLLDGNRKVGTLLAGEVKFREVVRDVPLIGAEAGNLAKVQALLADFRVMSDATLAKLSPIPVPQYVVPGPGIQVMRAKLEETYEIDGIGRDTVELQGWIAVRHGPARPTKGETELTWNTAVLDTEFVGMHLQGESGTFGPVIVTLDTTRPSLGQVGRIEIPELARMALVAKLKKETLADNAPAAAARAGGSRKQ